MADQPHDAATADREQVRAHYRAELARVAGIPVAVREAELRVVRETAAVRRRTAA